MVIKEYLLWEENLGTLKKHKEENKNHYTVANIYAFPGNKHVSMLFYLFIKLDLHPSLLHYF